MPKVPPDLDTEDDDLTTEFEPDGPPEKGAIRLHFYELPHYHENRRFDPRARGELAGVLPFTEDYEQRFARIAAPGWYAVEERRGGKVRESWALEIRPDERRVEPAAPKATAAPGLSAEEVAAIVARVLETQKSEFQREMSALREELRTREGKAAAGSTQSLRETLDLIKELREVAPELVGLNQSRGSEPKRSAEEELTLAIANRADLLGNVIERLSEVTSLARGGDDETETTIDRALRVFGKSPALQKRALRTWDALNARIAPNGGGDDEDEGDELDDEARADALLQWAMSKCAANEPISFDDEEVRDFREAAPEGWSDLVESLASSPVKTIITYFSGLSPLYAAVLKHKHAPAWVNKYLRAPAVELNKKSESSGEE
jgi:hypothetical protein